ncbi:hypothetical protein ACQKLX_05740 [Bosea sp. NPDC003192]|uniref:hypothetical protein n=1 Tax=Bosea sp. NPDC003192 TaxID=3390551 RepID=UPI003CFF5293
MNRCEQASVCAELLGAAINRARHLDRCRLDTKTMKRMVSYSARHAVDKQAKGFGDSREPSAGYIAWLLWGGDEGCDWAKREICVFLE